MSVRKLQPGQAVRVEQDARIVNQVEGNPYWYVVEYPTGARDGCALQDQRDRRHEHHAVLDTDCSIQVFSPRLSATGALDLLICAAP